MATTKSSHLGIEKTLWESANALRGSIDSSDYRHVVLGLLFLKYLVDSRTIAFGASQGLNAAKFDWTMIRTASRSKKPDEELDQLIESIERKNPPIAGLFPRFSEFEGLKDTTISRLVDLFSDLDFSGPDKVSEDLLSRTYEYFITSFAASEGRLGGEYYTPKSIVQLMVELVRPFRGKIYDPSCGMGGILLQVAMSNQRSKDGRKTLTFYGQESNPWTWRLAKLNLAVHGIKVDVGPSWGDTFTSDMHRDLKADFILTNPPFGKGTSWSRDELVLDPRWSYGVPPANPATFAWLQHYIARLNVGGTIATVMPNGALTSRGVDRQIRSKIVEAGLIECVIALPPQLFYSTPIPVSLWILSKREGPKGSGILMIDARDLGTMVSRTHRELSEDDIHAVSSIFTKWRATGGPIDEEHSPKHAVVSIQDVRLRDYSINPTEYVAHQSSFHPQSSLALIKNRSRNVEKVLPECAPSLNAAIDLLSESFNVSSRNKRSNTNWKTVRISDVARVISGSTPDTRNSRAFGGSIPWITPRDLTQTKRREVFWGERSLTDEGLTSCRARLVPKGSVLVSSRAPIGLIAIAGQELCTNQGIRTLVFGDDQDERFWYYLLKASTERLDSAGNGTTFRELRGSSLAEMTFSVPHLEAQRKIADSLSVFEHCARDLENARNALDELLDCAGPALTNFANGFDLGRS